jgi:hypothetical protein
MEAKEKAKELLNKMDVIHYMKLGGKNLNSKGLPVSMHDSQVKQCALIAANELRSETYMCLSDRKAYWEQVIREIEKL